MRTIALIFAALMLAPVSMRADFVQNVDANWTSKIKIKTDADTPAISALDFSLANLLVASASENLVCIWDLKTLEQSARFYNEAFGKISAVSIDADARFAYFCGGVPAESGWIVKLDLKSGEHETILKTSDEIMALAYNAKTNTIAAGSMDGELAIINAADGTEIFKSKESGEKIVGIDFSKNGENIAIAYASGIVKLRIAEDKFATVAGTVNTRANPIGVKIFARSAKNFVTASGLGADSKIVAYRSFIDRGRNEIQMPNFNPSAFCTTLAPFPIVVGNAHGDLKAFKASKDSASETYEKADMRIESLAGDGAGFVIGGGRNGEICIWQNFKFSLLCGFVILDKEGKDYAVWTFNGIVHATRKDAVEYTQPDTKNFAVLKKYGNKKTLETFAQNRLAPTKKAPRKKRQ